MACLELKERDILVNNDELNAGKDVSIEKSMNKGEINMNSTTTKVHEVDDEQCKPNVSSNEPERPGSVGNDGQIEISEKLGGERKEGWRKIEQKISRVKNNAGTGNSDFEDRTVRFDRSKWTPSDDSSRFVYKTKDKIVYIAKEETRARNVITSACENNVSAHSVGALWSGQKRSRAPGPECQEGQVRSSHMSQTKVVNFGANRAAQSSIKL